MKAIGKFKWGWTNSLELNPLGDCACEYEREASLFWENYPEILKELSLDDSSWCDVMVDNDGNTYAVIGEDSLSATFAKAVIVRVEM